MSEFVRRHIGPSRKHQSQMLKDLGLENIDELVTQIVPESILISKEEAYKNLPEGCGEEQALTELREIADKNTIKELLLKEIIDAVPFSLPKPTYEAGHRWLYGFTERSLGKSFLFFNEENVGICGDWCLGKTILDAASSGIKLAEQILTR